MVSIPRMLDHRLQWPPQQNQKGQESAETSDKFPELAAFEGIELQLSPVEVHHAVGIGKRYHAALLRIFLFVRKSYPPLSSHGALRLATKMMNETIGPERLVPSLLVFGVISSFPVINKPPRSHNELQQLLWHQQEHEWQQSRKHCVFLKHSDLNCHLLQNSISKEVTKIKYIWKWNAYGMVLPK